VPRSASIVAWELIRRLDINAELLRGGIPLTKTDMESTERLHHEWEAIRQPVPPLPAPRTPYWDAVEQINHRLQQAAGRDTDSVPLF
jgi:hypothetical protein